MQKHHKRVGKWFHVFPFFLFFICGEHCCFYTEGKLWGQKCKNYWYLWTRLLYDIISGLISFNDQYLKPWKWICWQKHTHFPGYFAKGSIYSTGLESMSTCLCVCVCVSMGGHNVTVRNTITSWWIKSITSPNPLNLGPRFIQKLDDFHLIHFKRWIHPVREEKPVMKVHWNTRA